MTNHGSFSQIKMKKYTWGSVQKGNSICVDKLFAERHLVWNVFKTKLSLKLLLLPRFSHLFSYLFRKNTSKRVTPIIYLKLAFCFCFFTKWPPKLWKMLFISNKKLFSFLRCPKILIFFVIFSLPSTIFRFKSANEIGTIYVMKMFALISRFNLWNNSKPLYITSSNLVK